jgi:hypothetical protein
MQVDAAVKELVPRTEREPVMPRIDRIDVDAVERNDRDRHEEKRDEPRNGQAEQARRRQVDSESAVRQPGFVSGRP